MAEDEFQRGRIAYLGEDGEETGREWFEMVRHARGRILRAFCEMDSLGLSRDVTLALDSESRPVDAFVRVIQRGEVLGSTQFILGNGELRVVGRVAGRGEIDQTLTLERPLGYLGLHPLVGDALIANARGTANLGAFERIACYTNSQSPAGEVGLYAMPVSIDVAYLGTETLDVQAGRYEARAYALRWKPEWEPARLWVHGDEALFLRLDWPMIGARYELAAHKIGR